VISTGRLWVGRVSAVACNTVQEAIRNRVLYALLFFAVLLIATGVLLSTLSYVERERILQDVGLGAIRLFGAAIAVFVGVGLIHREVDRRTIFTILSKPISRSEFLVGKYLGLVATLGLLLAIMGASFALVSLATGAPLGTGHLAALALVAVELALLVAVATLFSSFTTPMLASFLSVGIYCIGHMTQNLRNLIETTGSEGTMAAVVWLHRLFPDLESFNLTTQAVHGLPVEAAQVGWPIVYGLGWIAGLLLLASFIFERRDFR
jgi:ABC-type transport system involved in multi-copper enzyme maturation permease subunit